MWLFLLAFGCLDPVPTDDTDPVDDTATDTDPWPATLRGTGLYADEDTLADGVIAFEVAWPLWSDGSTKERFLWLPEGTVIDASDPDRWAFPVGTKAWKTFWRDGVRIETRYLERAEHGWVRVAYLWRDDGSDADPVPLGVEGAQGTDHDVPTTDDCHQCHVADQLLGISAIQLGDDSPTRTLDLLHDTERITPAITASTAVPGDGVVRDALGYLHGNCGGCHSDHAPWAASQELRLRIPVGLASVDDAPAHVTGIDQPTRHQYTTNVAIAPGDPEASQIYERMALRDNLAMPPLGTEQVDEAALEVIHDWIVGLAPGAPEGRRLHRPPSP